MDAGVKEAIKDAKKVMSDDAFQKTIEVNLMQQFFNMFEYCMRSGLGFEKSMKMLYSSFDQFVEGVHKYLLEEQAKENAREGEKK